MFVFNVVSVMLGKRSCPKGQDAVRLECFTKPSNCLQISTEIFILTGGSVFFPSVSDGPEDLSALGFAVFIVRHSGLIICKTGRVYFEGVQRKVWMSSVGAWLLLAEVG